MIKINDDKGVTLVALVITIIVLLILAWGTITTVAGDNGLISGMTSMENTITDTNIDYDSIYVEDTGADSD